MDSKNDIIEKAKNEYKANRSVKLNIDWQMRRYNLSVEEAIEKIENMRKQYSTASYVNTVEWQMQRFGISKDEAETKIKNAAFRKGQSQKEKPEFERKAISPKNKEHWIKKGYSLDESVKKAKDQISSMQITFQKKISESPNLYRDKWETQLDYWINKKGLTPEEAKLALRERQTTFTLEKCVKKYGEVDGTNKWKERQDMWKKKISEHFSKEGDSRTPSSKFANDCIKSISYILKVEIPKKEKYIYSKELKQAFAYDFCYNTKLIEFNGDYWHCNPNKYASDYFNKSLNMAAVKKWEIDKLKKETAKLYGYDVLVVWEAEYKNDPENTINKCINFLTA